MKAASKIAALAMVVGSVTGTATAQEPSKEETIAWLKEKIPQAAVGCNSYYQDTDPDGEVYSDYSSTFFVELKLNTNSNLPRIRVKKTITYNIDLSRKPGDTRTTYRELEFDFGLITDVSVIEPYSGHYENGDCSRVQIQFSRELKQTGSSRYVPSKVFRFVVNDERLGERIGRALEHLAKLEQSGAGEPF